MDEFKLRQVVFVCNKYLNLIKKYLNYYKPVIFKTKENGKRILK